MSHSKLILYSFVLKNILASKGRTLTTFLLSMFTTILFIVYVAFMDGEHEMIIKNSVEIYTGYAHINAEGYQDDSDYDHLIEDSDQIDSLLKHQASVSHFSPRFETYVLLAKQDKSVGSFLGGIVPSRERNLSHLENALIKGAYLEDNDTGMIYLGSDLAERLSVDIGDEVALIGSSLDYSIAADLLTVKGIFKTGLFEFDSSSGFVNKAYLDDLTMSENKASYFVLKFQNNEAIDRNTKALSAVLPATYEAVSWKTLLASLVQAMQVDSLFGYISISIFMLVIFFVIMIFSYVSIYTRTRQIGLLKALGLTPKDIRTLLFAEIFVISIVSITLGTIFGALIAYYLEVHPIVISGLADMLKEYGFIGDSIGTRFDLFTICWNSLSILALNLTSVLYPIYKINKLSAVEAMRYV